MAKGKAKAPREEEEETHQPLQAVVLADSFTQRFRPITIERPKCLLPLVNVPMLSYTLEWLATAGVEEALVFCASHAEQVQTFLDESGWREQPGFKVTVIISHDCTSAGEALRQIDQRNMIRSDFILVNADVVSNMKLEEAIAAHKARRKADKQAIMTIVTKRLSSRSHRTRLGDQELIVAMDPTDNQLLAYEECKGGHDEQAYAKLESALFKGRERVQLRNDLMDCHIDICAPEVLVDFRENFDYMNVRRDFVGGVLGEDLMGNKIFLHELGQQEFGARIHNLRTYDCVSRDIIQRWLYPIVPDNNVLPMEGPPSKYVYRRNNKYREIDVSIARSASIGDNTVIGAGTTIGQGTVVRNSVIGRNCVIGGQVVIEGCYLDSNVTVGERARLTSALVCRGAVVHADGCLNPGVIMSYNTVCGAGHSVAANSRVTLCQQEETDDLDSSDDELEYGRTAAPTISGDAAPEDFRGPTGTPGGLTTAMGQAALDDAKAGVAHQNNMNWDHDLVGYGGAGWRWESRDEDEWRLSIAPGTVLGAPEPDADDSGSEDETGGQPGADKGQETAEEEDEEEDEDYPEKMFRREVAETFLRCVRMGYDQANAVVELNALKLAEDRTFADLARYIFTTILSLSLPPPFDVSEENVECYAEKEPDSDKELLLSLHKRVQKWAPLLRRFLKNHDDQVELLLTYEEMCLEDGVFAKSGCSRFAGLFQHVLKLFYDADVIEEDSILAWADEKKDAEEEDKKFVNMCEAFLTWLREAESDDDDDDDDEDED